MDTTLQNGAPLITGNEELMGVCTRLASCDWVGVDTEFLRERTYYAKLCLVQLSSEAYSCVVDVLAVDDLAPLAGMLAGDARKVFHAARQDFEVLYQSCGGVPVRAFDTQLAAAFCGYPDQIGYAGLVREELGVGIAKHQTRTDWSRRPLSSAQMEYALADVQFLGELYGRLESRMSGGGKLAWFEEEILALSAEEQYKFAPDQAYTKVKGARKLRGDSKTVLKNIAAWREEQAMKRNLPRSWVLGDAILVLVARTRPQDLDTLAECEGINPRFVRRHGAELIDRLRTVPVSADDAPELSRPGAPSATERRRASGLMQAVANRAGELDIAPSLLATRKDVEALIRAGESIDAVEACSVMKGWRRDVIGNALLEV